MAHISFEKSIEILKNNLPKVKDSERVFLFDSLNRVLATDIVAKYNNPYKKTASMDGFAIRYEDIENEIKIVGKNPAGVFKYQEINENEAIKTYTGSFIPKNANTLVPIESVEIKNDKLIVKEKVEKGFAIREIGEDFKKGEVLIKKGTLIRPAEIGVLASLGESVVDVVKKAKISIITTGEEIVDLNDDYKIGQIRSSNNYTLYALAKYFGYDVYNLGIVKDDKILIKKKILSALNDSDIVVTTGGVSVGDFDFVKDIIKEFEVLFYGVNIKPGQWVMVAKVNNKYIVSLPGFPYSSFITFLLYVTLVADAFENKTSLKKVKAILRDDFKKVVKKTQFVAVNLSFEDNKYVVDVRGKKSGSSAILTNLIKNNSIMILKEGFYTLKAGEEVEIVIY